MPATPAQIKEFRKQRMNSSARKKRLLKKKEKMADSCEELEGDVDDFEEFSSSIAQAFENTPKITVKPGHSKVKGKKAHEEIEKKTVKEIKTENQDHDKKVSIAESKEIETSKPIQTALKENEGTKSNSEKQDKNTESSSEKQDKNTESSSENLNKDTKSNSEKEAKEKEVSLDEKSKKIQFEISNKAGLKRKVSEDVQPGFTKVKKVETSKKDAGANHRNLFSAVEQGTLKEKTEPNVAEQPITDEEGNEIDEELVEKMFKQVKENKGPKGKQVYTLRFGPLEIADLADSGLQDLIKYQPKISIYFKKQTGKHKKKKGYGEMCSLKVADINKFLRKLCQINVFEKRLEISISATYNYESDYCGTFTLLLDKASSLVKLLEEEGITDKKKYKGTNFKALVKQEKNKSKFYFHLEEVPIKMRFMHVKTIFPFTSYVIDNECKENRETKTKGPIDVFYSSAQWLKAVSECFTDFAYNGTPLNLKTITDEKDETAKKTETKDSKDAGTKIEIGEGQTVELAESTADSSKKTTDSPQPKSKKTKGNKEVTNDEEDKGEDDAISNMTRDDMLESLSKLKQLETDNPNIQKILEMQEQVATLQKTLSKSKSGNKMNKLSPAERKKLEMEELQQHIEDAQEIAMKKDEMSKKIREMEMLVLKEQEEKRRAGWAKKMIEDLKQEGGGAAENSATKKEAQKLLQAREEKLRQKKAEEEKLEQEAKEEAAKAEIKEIILPFQDMISTPEAKVSDSHSKDKEGTTSEKQNAGSNKDSDAKKAGVKSVKEPEKKPEKQINEISESHYKDSVLNGRIAELPPNFRVSLKFYENRGCPVQGCPASRFFKTHDGFLDHWQIFHKANMTVRFCPKCSAFFNQGGELNDHLKSRHSINSWRDREDMMKNLRTKVIRNASYRDPGYFLFK